MWHPSLKSRWKGKRIGDLLAQKYRQRDEIIISAIKSQTTPGNRNVGEVKFWVLFSIGFFIQISSGKTLKTNRKEEITSLGESEKKVWVHGVWLCSQRRFQAEARQCCWEEGRTHALGAGLDQQTPWAEPRDDPKSSHDKPAKAIEGCTLAAQRTLKLSSLGCRPLPTLSPGPNFQAPTSPLPE